MSSQPNNSNNNSNSDAEEGLIAHVVRVCKNSCTKCFGVVQTTDEYAKIKYKEYQIENRKKQFGVDYFELLTNPNATEAEKQTCIDAVLKDTATVTKEIEVLQQEIERVQQTTKDKIVAKPGTTATTATTTTTTPPAATAVEAPTTTTPPVPPTPPTEDVEVTATTNHPMVTEDPTMSEVPLTSTPTTNH